MSREVAGLASTTPLFAEIPADHPRDILDAIPDAIVIVDGEGKIVYANRQISVTLGYAPDELLGRPYDLLLPERLRGVHATHVRRYREAPKRRPMGVGLTLVARGRDGAEVPIEVSLSPLGSEPSCSVVVTIRDVRERTRLEQTKELLANRLACAVSMVPDALALFDADDRLVLCNAKFRERFQSRPIEGRTYEELVDTIFDLAGVSDEAERARRKAERLACRTEGPGRRIETPDGKCLRIFERRTAEGGTVTVVTDLSEDERIASELRDARTAAEAASRAKSEFLSSMSHELRTPLNAIVGFAQLMRRDKRDPLSAQGKERIDQIIRAGAHLANLVDDILDLSRIEAERVSISVEATGVGEVMSRAREAIESIAEERQVVVVEEPPPEEGLMVLADRTRLIQIVTNFATNAVKYNRPGGRVILAATRSAHDRVRLAVTDTGMGIPTEKQGLLFQPFQRAGQETGPIEGTGIGLVIAKSLAEMMGATVGFCSTPGEGSRFWVDVAASSRTEAASAPPEPPPIPTVLSDREVVVLYIEDNPANASFMRALFATVDNAKLLVAPTAEEGIALAIAHSPDAIIMDVNLPGMNGIDALHVLQRDARTARTPVIALTAAASPQERHAGAREGFAHYLVKPVQIEAILQAVASVLPAAKGAGGA